MMKKKLLKIVFILSFCNSVFPQSGLLSLSNVTPCPEQSFYISLYGYGFNNLGAATIFVEYDSAFMTFNSIVNNNEYFSALKVNEFNADSKNVIGISWYNINGVNIDSLNLFDLVFTYKSGITEIALLDATELADKFSNVLLFDFQNSTVTPSITINLDPSDKSTYFPESTFFSLIAEGADDFRWQVSNNEGASFSDLDEDEAYKGVNSDTLEIASTFSYMNNYLYRCKLSNPTCLYHSKPAKLSLIFPPPGDLEVTLNPGWNSFSSNLYAGSYQMDSVFSSIFNTLIVITEGVNTYFPYSNDNTLKYFDSKQGYQIKVLDTTEIFFEGYEIMNTAIELNQGWNLMPILCTCQISIADFQTNFLENVEVIKDGVGLQVYWPSKNINTLQILEPGKSYFIKMDVDMQLLFPPCNP